MPYPYLAGTPGRGATKTARHKQVSRGEYMRSFLPGGKIIDGTKSRDPSNADDVTVLQPGLLMGIISATGYYAPSIYGVANGAVAAGATTITVAAAVLTELVRRVGATSGTFKLTGPPAASGVVTTETVTFSAASGTSITCTATVNPYVSGSFIQPTDGSETPITLLPDGFGVPVTQWDGTAVTTVEYPDVMLGEMLLTANIVNWPSDVSLRRWIQARLNDIDGGQFVFDSRY